MENISENSTDELGWVALPTHPNFSENTKMKTEHIAEAKGDIKKIGDFQCPHCNKTFSSKQYMKVHIKKVHDMIRDHMCDICSKTFATPKDLANHQFVHTGEKQYPCHICGKSYQSKDYLIIHTRMHTGEKPYFCELCGKSFSDPSSYAVHKKQHTQENF